MLNPRILIGTCLLLAGLCSAVDRISAQPLTSSASLCGMGLEDIHFLDQCLPPGKIARAEARMSVPPTRPVRIVRRITGLWLTQLRLRASVKPIEIDYLLGHIPIDPEPSHQGLADMGSSLTRYVLVGELTYRLPPGAPRIYSMPTVVNTVTVPGYWVFQSNFRCSSLMLSVTSNGPRRWVKQIGQRVLQAQVCGK